MVRLQREKERTLRWVVLAVLAAMAMALAACGSDDDEESSTSRADVPADCFEDLEVIRYDLDELVAGITDQNRHDLIDFGEPVGREVW